MSKLTIELDKEDLISLVKGTIPYYGIMEDEVIRNNGSFTGGNSDKWIWHDCDLKQRTEEELLEIYIKCRASWIK